MKIATPSAASIAEAGQILKRGGLVVMPTETVYGLAGSIRNEAALQRIFEVKNRPSDNPLIVHISEVATLGELCLSINDSAQVLAERFWPGPLTLVLNKRPEVSGLISAGGATVAVRIPNHAVALALIEAASSPLAAPSANRFMQLSPTAAEHVDPLIGDEVSMILDGGPCSVGIESTVVDCTSGVARILRPGVLGLDEIGKYVECVKVDPFDGARRSPGLFLRHYSPKTSLRIADCLGSQEGGITFHVPANENQLRLPQEPMGYAAQIYAALHLLDQKHLAEIVVESPPKTSDWVGIWDRLRKASQS